MLVDPENDEQHQGQDYNEDAPGEVQGILGAALQAMVIRGQSLVERLEQKADHVQAGLTLQIANTLHDLGAATAFLQNDPDGHCKCQRRTPKNDAVISEAMRRTGRMLVPFLQF